MIKGITELSRVMVTTRSVGSFIFDVVTIEDHSSSLRLTENPIEFGAAVADHAVLEPKKVSMTGVMVSYEPPVVNQIIKSVMEGNVKLPALPIDLKTVKDQSIQLAKRYITKSESLATTQRVLAPFLPDYQLSERDTSNSLDRVGRAYNALLNIQKKGEPITIQTGLKLYENMMLIDIGVTQSTDESAEFSLTLREIFIVSTKKTSGIHPSIKDRVPQKKQMGKTLPLEKDRSVLHRIIN